MRFLGWWFGFAVVLEGTRALDIYLLVFLLTLIAVALTFRRQNKFLWRLSRTLGAEPASLRLVASLGFFVLGTGALVAGFWLSPGFVGRLLLALGYACYVKVILNLVADAQDRYLKRRWH